MSTSMMNKTHLNGYEVVNVNFGPWRVCTDHDRLGSFGTREEAMAFAAALPVYRQRAGQGSAVPTAKAQPKVAKTKSKAKAK